MQSLNTSMPLAQIEPTVDLSIIIVCHNNKRYLRPCLQSLFQGGLRTTFNVIVIDNGSSDGTCTMVHREFPQVHLIQNKSNVGLSRASNQGIMNTHAQYVLLLNDDTHVNGVSLDAMVQFMQEHPRTGAVGGKLLNADGTFQAGYSGFSDLLQEFLIATRLSELIAPGYPSHGGGDAAKQVDWLSSACLLLRRAALNEVGLLEEEYFVYGDEVDLQYRLKQAGWQVFYLPEATTIHFGGRSMNRWRRRKMVYRGKLLFYQKNYSRPRQFVLRVMFATLSVCKSLLWILVLPIPCWRQRAEQELNSNWDVIKLCWSLR